MVYNRAEKVVKCTRGGMLWKGVFEERKRRERMRRVAKRNTQHFTLTHALH